MYYKIRVVSDFESHEWKIHFKFINWPTDEFGN